MDSRQGFGFIRAVVMTCRIDSQRAQVDEPLQRLALAGPEKVTQSLDVDCPIILHRTPIADLGRTMDDDLCAFQRPLDQFEIAEVATVDAGPEALQQGRVAVGTGDGADGMATCHTGFRQVSADEARGAGNEDAYRHQSDFVCRAAVLATRRPFYDLPSSSLTTSATRAGLSCRRRWSMRDWGTPSFCMAEAAASQARWRFFPCAKYNRSEE